MDRKVVTKRIQADGGLAKAFGSSRRLPFACSHSPTSGLLQKESLPSRFPCCRWSAPPTRKEQVAPRMSQVHEGLELVPRLSL